MTLITHVNHNSLQKISRTSHFLTYSKASYLLVALSIQETSAQPTDFVVGDKSQRASRISMYYGTILFVAWFHDTGISERTESH